MELFPYRLFYCHLEHAPASADFILIYSSFEAQEQLSLAQLFAYGQPIHFCPFFFARTIYAIAPPIIKAITAITIISAGFMAITLKPL